MREIWIKRLGRVTLKETRPVAVMKRVWLTKLKKRMRLQPAAEPEPRGETVEQEAVGEETAAQKTVEVVSVQLRKGDFKSIEASSERPRQPRTATSLRSEIHVSEETASIFYTIKSKPAGSVKTVSRSIKTIEPEAQLPKPRDENSSSTESAVPQVKRFQQAALVAKASKTSVKLVSRAAKAAASAVKEMVSLLIAGGWVSVLVIVLVCGIALIGVFLSGQDRNVSWQGTGPFEWPLPQDFTITSPFGERIDPITGEVSFHTGTDIAAPEGTPILAAAGGVVTGANSTNPRHSYGYYIKLQHDNEYETLYAHCSALCVRAGQEVPQGEVIGFVGSTGDSTGNHLHFEVREDGMRVDVMEFFISYLLVGNIA